MEKSFICRLHSHGELGAHETLGERTDGHLNLHEKLFLRTEVIDIPTTGTAATFHFDPTQVAQFSLQVDFQRGVVTIQTQVSEAIPIQEAHTTHNTDELERAALTQALLAQRLPQIFATVLGIPVEQMGETTDFFEYGGDSLAIAALLTAIEERFHLRLEPDLIFDHPVLEDLAAAIAQQQKAQPTTIKREAVLA